MTENSKHTILGAGPLGTSLTGLLATDGKDAQLFSIMNNPAYDMPGTVPNAEPRGAATDA